LFERGARLGAAETGLLAAVGVERVRVARRPRVAILATGSELVGPGQPLRPGQIRNSNSYTAYGQTVAAGADPILLGIARDDLDETRRLMAAALENDVVVTTGGVSVGDYDFVKQVQDELGVQRRFWGVATKPGKPLAFGTRRDTLVFGVPGNPVSSMVAFEMYVRPALLALQGRQDVFRPWFQAESAEPVRRSKLRTEVRRCRLTHEGGRVRFTTTGPQGSGILSSMAGAEGVFFVPPGYPGGEAGDEFLVMLLSGSGTERPPFPGAPSIG
jgi:molybdopterin molybdotransferase